MVVYALLLPTEVVRGGDIKKTIQSQNHHLVYDQHLPMKFSQDLYCSCFDNHAITVVLTVILRGRGSDVDL